MLWIRSACMSQCCWRSTFAFSFCSGERFGSRSISVNSLIRSGRTNESGSSGFRNARPCSERSDSFDFSSMVKKSSSFSANSSGFHAFGNFGLEVLRLQPVKHFNRIIRDAVSQHRLLPNELIDERLPLVILMGRNRGGPADDERRAGFVDQDGIDFIDDGVIVAA